MYRSWSAFEGKVRVPREHSFGSGHRTEVDEIIAKCIDLVEACRLHLPTVSRRTFVLVPESLVISFLEGGAHEQNRKEMKKLSPKHFFLIFSSFFQNFEQQLDRECHKSLGFIDKMRQWINQQAKLIFPSFLLFQVIEYRFSMKEINEPHSYRVITWVLVSIVTQSSYSNFHKW